MARLAGCGTGRDAISPCPPAPGKKKRGGSFSQAETLLARARLRLVKKRWFFQSKRDSLHMAGQSQAKARAKPTTPGAAGPRAPQARRGFRSALSPRSGRPCVEISHCEVEQALFREVAEISP